MIPTFHPFSCNLFCLCSSLLFDEIVSPRVFACFTLKAVFGRCAAALATRVHRAQDRTEHTCMHPSIHPCMHACIYLSIYNIMEIQMDIMDMIKLTIRIIRSLARWLPTNELINATDSMAHAQQLEHEASHF